MRTISHQLREVSSDRPHGDGPEVLRVDGDAVVVLRAAGANQGPATLLLV